MARTSVKKNVIKPVNYLNKDFSDFRDNLIEFARQYFPNTYNDFNEASPGMMFIEMAAYVGDVLSYYIDSQFRETLLAYAEEKKNVYTIAQSFGYKPKTTTPANVVLDVFQTIPALNGEPDYRYALNVKAGATIKSTTTGKTFRTIEDANFKFNSQFEPRVTTIFESNGGTPTKYLLKKQVRAESGEVATEFFTFGTAQKYSQIKLGNTDVIHIISCIDDDGNSWYEVDSLARDTIFTDVENNSSTDPPSVTNREVSPYLLKLRKVPKRFTTFIDENENTFLRFGAGVSDNPDEEIIPNPDNVGSALGFGVSRLDESFDPSNFLKTRTFGLAPSNTTLTVTYNYGGAVEHNVASNTIQSFNRLTYTNSTTGLNSDTLDTVRASLTVNNEDPASGGASTETITEIKQNAAAYFNAQNRAVTKADYITRVYSLPHKYGNIAKAFIVQDEQLETSGQLQIIDGEVVDTRATTEVKNPLALNMYLLGYGADKTLVRINKAVKQNVKTYLSQYRLLTDAINLKDGYIINIGVKYNIITKTGYNKNDVLLRTIQKVKEFFQIDKWQMNQPIVLGDLAYQISLVDGVVSVVPPQDNNPNNDLIVIENKHLVSGGYSGNVYDLQAATKDGVIYPSMDPAIFEIKFPNTDIEGRVVGDM